MFFETNNINSQEYVGGYESIPKENIKGISILLHGYGASVDDLIFLAPILAQDLQDYYFFAPNAIDQYKGGGGYQWFKIEDTQDIDFNEEFHKGLLYCQNKATKLIDQKIKEIKNKYSLGKKCPISILGFSQGAMLALRLVCNNFLPEVEKVVSFSGAFINHKELDQLNTNAKILLLHGKEDSVINYTYSLRAKQELDDLGFKDVKYEIFNNLGHAISYEGVKLAAKFIASSI